MYIFAYACACVCTSSADRLRSYRPIFLRKLFYTLLFFTPKLHPPSVSFNGFNSPFGFSRQPNDARKRANHWPGDTCAILIWRHVSSKIVSHPRPIFFFSGKENCPEKLIEERSRPREKLAPLFFPFSFS